MTTLEDITGLIEGLCSPRGIHFAVRVIPAADEDCLNREADTHLLGEERQWLNQLRSMKRRSEFLAGRTAAKSVLSRPPFCLQTRSLEIYRNPLGAPRIRDHAGIGLSIAHSSGYAVAIAATVRLGVDLERDEARPDAFRRFFLSAPERAALERLSPPERQNAVNQFWSRKEAACKVGGWGSTLALGELDTSRSCTMIQTSAIRLTSGSRAGFVASVAWELSLDGAVKREVPPPRQAQVQYG